MTNIVTQRFIKCHRELRERNIIRSSRQFAIELEYLPQSLSEILNGRRDVTIELIRKTVEIYHFNPNFLFTGLGSLFSDPGLQSETKRLSIVKDTNEKEQIIFVPVAAQITYAMSDNNPEFIEKLPTFSLPEPKYATGTHRAFEIADDSMEPTVFEGDKVVGSFLEPELWQTSIKNNYVYVIVAKNEVHIKRVMRVPENTKTIQLLSDNHFFQPAQIEFKDVSEIWYVRARISPFLPSPNRIQELFIEEMKSLKTKIVEQTTTIGLMNKSIEKMIHQ